MSKLTKLFSNFKIWVYILFLILTLFAISPNPWNEGVVIRNVELNSSAANAGFKSSLPTEAPMVRERIVQINGVPIATSEDYGRYIQTVEADDTLNIVTEKSTALFLGRQQKYVAVAQEQGDIGITVYDAPKSNIRLGLDLQGGTRVVLQPDEKLSKEDMDSLIENLNQRINILGLSDTVIRDAQDLTGNQFVIIEIAGANEKDVEDLLAKQGKFEAKIGNETVFRGGKQDITFVCRSAQCSGIDPMYGCRPTSDGLTACRFYFQITLSHDAAQSQADATRDLDVVFDGTSPDGYLSQDLDLYLDDVLVDTLKIGSSLKGQASTEIQISGSGFGQNLQEARKDTNANLKKLQTVLITGSLPVKLNIIKTDSLSPSLGREFLSNALLISVLSIMAVTLIVMLRYRKFSISLPIITIITSEILLILGISALLKQNLDIAGIAGIIVAIGTGVDDQIVITDEAIGKHEDDEEYQYLNWSQRIKKAFFIVIAAYVATMASMTPLLFAGAGLLKGFAVTTMIGVTNGVFITRPAFAEMIKIAVSGDDEEE
jgi:preprotein translocase subunit SecD